MRKINVGLIGFGTIGSGVAQVLQTRRPLLKNLTGVDIGLRCICDKDLVSERGVKVDKKILTRDVNKILKAPDIDIVVELIGGIHPAKEFILTALKNGKDVVTANKALLAEEGSEIFETAKRFNKEVRYEASVGGGIPIIKALREGLVSNTISEICGIINGTSNYILSRMGDEGCDYQVALKAAQGMGIAEASPELDVEGVDSAHKLILLAGISFGVFPKLSQVYCEGILAIEPRDIRYAKEMGYCIKLLAIAKRTGGMVEVRVHPTLVSERHLLANVKGVYNAIYLKGDLTGETLFYGEGAGKFPTASAVVADIVDLGKRNSILLNRRDILVPHKAGNPVYPDVHKFRIKKMDEIESKYYIRFTALDKPGVLAKIAGILGKNNISIASVSQKEVHSVKAVPIVIMTHVALESNLRRALRLIDALPVIKKKSVVIRMETYRVG